MHIFISAGEPSGDIHAANLARALQRADPNITLTGFGGEQLSKAGCQLLYPLCDLAVMWILRVLANLPKFIGLLDQAEDHFRRTRPDAVVLIDYPGFHWHLARRAKRAGIPVFYFVPPQLWAWAGWRAEKMKRLVDHTLAALPFEDHWFRQRGVSSECVGHPYFDELNERQLDHDFLAQVTENGPTVALLPGSRRQEITKNLPMMLHAVDRIHQERPDVRFLIASLNEAQAELAGSILGARSLPIEIHARKTPEIIQAATTCISVSGSVSLELMVRLKPTVIVYRAGLMLWALAQLLKKCRYITLVNLIAEKELFPELAGTRDQSPAIAAQTLQWLNQPETRDALITELKELRDRVAQPGACDRAVAAIFARLSGGQVERTAA